MKKLSRKEKCIYFILTMIFLLFQIACMQLEAKGDLEWSFGLVCKYLAFSVIGTVTLFGVVYGLRLLGAQYGEKLAKRIATGKVNQFVCNLSCKKVFFLVWGILGLCWLPIYLAFYPGLLAYDAGVQMSNQVINGLYNNHHPLLHTLLIEVFVDLGDLLGNRNLGVGLYSLMQMLALSATFAAGITFLKKRGVGALAQILLTLYFALFPTHGYLASSMTKDVYFTVFVLLFLFLFLTLTEKEKCSWIYHVAYVVSLVILQMLRNNGKYALLVFLGMFFLWILFTWKKEGKKYLLIFGETLLSLVLSTMLLSGMDQALNAAQGDKREMLSIPIQQLARTMYYHGDEVAEDTSLQALMDEFLLNKSYENYQASLADPVKRNTNTYVVRYRTKEFLQMYLGLFTRYPDEYINAFLAVNSGYFSVLDESHAAIYQNTGVKGVGYIQTRWDEANFENTGIYKDSKWTGLASFLEDWTEENKHLGFLPIRILAAPGAYLWLYLYLAVWVCFRRKPIYLVPICFVAGYYATLVFGPTVQLRYLYPLMSALPFLWLVFLKGRKED